MKKQDDGHLMMIERNSLKSEGFEEGHKKGIEDGEKKAKIEIAKKMLNMNLKMEDIIEATGLTKEEIEELK